MKNKINNACKIEIRPLTIDDFEVPFAGFQNENDGNAVFAKSSNYAGFFVDWVKNPVFYFRMVNPDSQRWAGIVEFSDDPIGVQNGLNGRDLAQSGTETVPFGKICDSPKTFEILSPRPYSSIRYTDDGKGGVIGEIKEGENGSILDLKVTPMPLAVINHASEYQPMPYFVVTTLVTGTYMGRPVRGTGLIDRYFMPQKATESKKKEESFYSEAYNAIFGIYAGVREDGRKEWM